MQIEEPTCTNCSQPLGASSLYCERCIRRDNELWYVWRERLAVVRGEPDRVAIEAALHHADWWAGRVAVQPESGVTETMVVLAAEVRRLQSILDEQPADSEQVTA